LDILLPCKGLPSSKQRRSDFSKKFLDNHPRPNPFTENLPSRGWMRAFLRRHPKVSLRTSEAITAASANISEADIRKWFIEIESYLKEKNVFDILEDPNRVFLMVIRRASCCARKTRRF
jgi:hypothetical protein